MTIALYILAFQTILGALDNVLHHELTERLPSKPSARFELALHSAREGIYGILFLIIFCETGLVITPFLPGDSLLFVAGAIAASGVMEIILTRPSSRAINLAAMTSPARPTIQS